MPRIEAGNCGEKDLAEVHLRLHSNHDEMAELEEKHWHVHPLPTWR